MKVLVTGAGGFIGDHVTERLLARGDEVVGFNSINDCDSSLKHAHLARVDRGIVSLFSRHMTYHSEGAT